MKQEIVYPELSYKVVGILYTVHNEHGRYKNEKQYADAVEKYLKEFKMPYEREWTIPISFERESTGRNRIDFIIDDKIVLETKAKRFLNRTDYYQTMRYLEAAKKRLGILVNFHQHYLTPKRILSRIRD